jgi:hypothetical protein
MKAKQWIVSFAALAALLGPSCASTTPERSTGTNWLTCHDDSDCASFEGATCGDEKLCIDRAGAKIAQSGCELPRVADYDHSCAVDRDCALVPEGENLCDPEMCVCDGAPISSRDEARYRADLGKVMPAHENGVCHCPAGIAPVCYRGTCTAVRDVPPPATDAGPVCGTISAADYDQSCTKNDDCVLVNDGDLCDADRCECGNAVVNAGAQPEYQADFEAKYTVPALVCPCIAPFPPVCNGGVCAMGTGL